ncbi:unnamed protein product [Linum trigynum]
MPRGRGVRNRKEALDKADEGRQDNITTVVCNPATGSRFDVLMDEDDNTMNDSSTGHVGAQQTEVERKDKGSAGESGTEGVPINPSETQTKTANLVVHLAELPAGAEQSTVLRSRTNDHREGGAAPTLSTKGNLKKGGHQHKEPMERRNDGDKNKKQNQP